MKRILLFTAIVLLAALALVGCQRVPPGYVGVKVYLLGSNKGIQQEVLTVGRYRVGVNQELHLYPIFVKQYSFTKAITEGDPVDEAFYFQTKDGNKCDIDIAVQCQAIPDKVSVLFQKYREDMSQIIHVNIRSYLRDYIIEYASNLTVDEAYGPKKMEMLKYVEDRLRKTMLPFGIDIVAVSYISDIRVPKSIEDAINAKNQAVQEAMQRENEVAKAQAEANIKIAQARGESESNKIKQMSITEATLKWQALQNEQQAIARWDGKLPQYLTPNTPLPFLGLKQ
jgi:regulator of protease activity HflC (stomatin/prohibitin superfamily)